MLVVAALGGNALQRRGRAARGRGRGEQREARRGGARRDRARAPARRHARQRSADRAARAAVRGVPRRPQLPARSARRRERGNDRLPPRARARERVAGAARRVAAHADRGRRARPRVPQARRSRSARCTTPTRRSVWPRERGWTVAPDGDGWRRVVASPVPRSIVELPTIELLLEHDVLVVCAGGGGVPVVIDSSGVRHGVEAVVDKDAATALLARNLGADLLLLLTDVAGRRSSAGARPTRGRSARSRARELRPASSPRARWARRSPRPRRS